MSVAYAQQLQVRAVPDPELRGELLRELAARGAIERLRGMVPARLFIAVPNVAGAGR